MERMPPPSGQKVDDDDSDFISELSYLFQIFDILQKKKSILKPK